MSGYVLRRSLLSLLTLGAILVVAGGVVVALGVPVWIPAIVAVVLIAVQYMVNPLLMQWLVPATRIPVTPDGSGYETDHVLGAIVARRCREAGIPLVRLGPVSILHLPGEPFIEYQLYAQSLSTGFVAVAGYGEGGPGYVCTDEACVEGGYQPGASRVCPPSEQRLREAIAEAMQP